MLMRVRLKLEQSSKCTKNRYLGRELVQELIHRLNGIEKMCALSDQESMI